MAERVGFAPRATSGTRVDRAEDKSFLLLTMSDSKVGQIRKNYLAKLPKHAPSMHSAKERLDVEKNAF
jgi:hypothetical protein